MHSSYIFMIFKTCMCVDFHFFAPKQTCLLIPFLHNKLLEKKYYFIWFRHRKQKKRGRSWARSWELNADLSHEQETQLLKPSNVASQNLWEQKTGSRSGPGFTLRPSDLRCRPTKQNLHHCTKCPPHGKFPECPCIIHNYQKLETT